MKESDNINSYSAGITMKKGVQGTAVAAISLLVAGLFNGLSPEQHNATVIITVGLVETVRNILKKRLPKFFSWL